MVTVNMKKEECYEINVGAQRQIINAKYATLTELVFMHDNDPKHSSRLFKNCLEENKVKVYCHGAAQSPYMIPIENLIELKTRVKVQKPSNLKELAAFVAGKCKNVPNQT